MVTCFKSATLLMMCSEWLGKPLHNNGPHQYKIFDNPSGLCLALWAKNRIRLDGGGTYAPNRLFEKGVGLSLSLCVSLSVSGLSLVCLCLSVSVCLSLCLSVCLSPSDLLCLRSSRSNHKASTIDYLLVLHLERKFRTTNYAPFN